jgi:phosphoglycolate phosphatase
MVVPASFRIKSCHIASMHLLLDLDGTLTDSMIGIHRSVNHALAELGRDAVAEPQLREMVGAPLITIFGVLLASDDATLLDRAIGSYRARFDAIGLIENRIFPGIPEALHGFRESGHSLQVVTGKPAVTAKRVVKHFGLDGYFEAIHGPELSDRSCNKADLIMAALNVAGPHAADAVMVGDRAEDVGAARAHGVRAVGAGWGYGSRAELTAAVPDYLAETVSDLVAWVQSAASHSQRTVIFMR